MAIKKRGLGKGLDALLGDLVKENRSQNISESLSGELKQVAMNQIVAGKYQPRTNFDANALQELANSIKAQGVIQPIVIRSIDKDCYEIVAGERRFRAAQLAGLEKIPALVKELPDEATVAVALIENIQREDLNPIEEAQAMARLIEEFDLTHEQVANAVGKSRTSVSNLLRLLSLPQFLQQHLQQGKIEMGHARAMLSLGIEQQQSLMNVINLRSLSVRQTEDIVRKMQQSDIAQDNIENKKDAHLIDIEQKIANHLHAKVQVSQNAKGKGKIVVQYKNAKQLKEILLTMFGE